MPWRPSGVERTRDALGVVVEILGLTAAVPVALAVLYLLVRAAWGAVVWATHRWPW